MPNLRKRLGAVSASKRRAFNACYISNVNSSLVGLCSLHEIHAGCVVPLMRENRTRISDTVQSLQRLSRCDLPHRDHRLREV